jgi:hypothetical protein
MTGRQLLAAALAVTLFGGALATAGCVNVTTAPKPDSTAPSQSSGSGAATSGQASTFTVGQSVAAVWSDGNLYLANVTAVDGDKVTVKYVDDSSTKTVAAADVTPIPDKTWAVGDEVQAVWSSGRFYDGTITKATGSSYEVKWEDGSAPSQVAGSKIIAR